MKSLSILAAGLVVSGLSSNASADDLICRQGLITAIGALSKDNAWGADAEKFRVRIGDSSNDYISYSTLGDPSTRAMLAVAISAFNTAQPVYIAGSYCHKGIFTQLTTIDH